MESSFRELPYAIHGIRQERIQALSLGKNAISAKRQVNGPESGSIDFCAAIRTGAYTERRPLPHLRSISPDPSLPLSSAWRSGTFNCLLLFAMSARLKKRSVSQLAQKKIQPAQIH